MSAYTSQIVMFYMYHVVSAFSRPAERCWATSTSSSFLLACLDYGYPDKQRNQTSYLCFPFLDFLSSHSRSPNVAYGIRFWGPAHPLPFSLYSRRRSSPALLSTPHLLLHPQTTFSTRNSGNINPHVWHRRHGCAASISCCCCIFPSLNLNMLICFFRFCHSPSSLCWQLLELRLLLLLKNLKSLLLRLLLQQQV